MSASERMSIPSILARVLTASFFGFVCIFFWRHFRQTGRVTSLLWMVSEGLVVTLLVIRRETKAVSLRPLDWIASFGGTFTGLLARPSRPGIIPDGLGALLQILGIGVQILGKAALGRSFGIVPANRGVIVAGPYRIVRHPIYLGYILTHVGFLLSNWSVRNLAVYGVAELFQLLRILSEERFLAGDAGYRDYRERVRYRLIPGVF